MNESLKQIAILPQNLNGKRSKSQVQDIYSKPLLAEFGEQTFLFPRSMRDISDAKRASATMLVIGNIPSYVVGNEALVDGFVHLVVDKYIFQNIGIIAPQARRLKILLISSIYGRCRPSDVLVNNREMKDDFEEAFLGMGLDVRVHVVPHPVTAHNLDLYTSTIAMRKQNDDGSPPLHLLSDSGYSLEACGAKQVFGKPLSTFIKSLPYNKFQDKIAQGMSQGAFIGLFNFRRDGVLFKWSARKFFSKDYWHPFYRVIKKQRRISILLIALHDAIYCFKNNNSQTLNARWKPSTKLSTAVALALPLVSEVEASLVDFSDSLKYPVFFYDSISDFERVYSRLSEQHFSVRAHVEMHRAEAIQFINSAYAGVFREVFFSAAQ